MAVDYKTIAELSADDCAKAVLHVVARGRSVDLGQILRADISREAAMGAISKLRNAALIKETPAPIDELKTYFVTANGLAMDRLVRQ